MRDPLATLVAATLEPLSPRTRDEAVKEFIDAVGAQVHGNVDHRGGGRRPLPDIMVPQPRGTGPLAIQVVVWRQEGVDGAGIASRIGALHRDADRIRQDHPEVSRLALLVVVPEAGDTTLEPSRFEELTTEYANVVLGLAGSGGPWWCLRHGDAPVGLPDFGTAIGHLSAAPEPVPVTPAAVPPAIPRPGVPATRAVRVLLIGDDWSSGRGGVPRLNRDLATAFAAAGLDVHVYVPRATRDQIEEAWGVGVRLLVADPIPGIGDGLAIMLAKPPFREPGYAPDVIVGHGRHLGPYAYGLWRDHFPGARLLQVVHTDPTRLEDSKEDLAGPSRMRQAADRNAVEVKLAMSAYLVAGVGPLLKNAIRTKMLGRPAPAPPVVELQPGLRDWGGTVDAAAPPAFRRVLLIARAEDVRSKGIDLAVRALSEVTKKMSPDLDERPVLVIRGMPEPVPEDVRTTIHELAEPDLEVHFQPFTIDEEDLRADLWSCRVAIMPSRHEGFGLAAYEAMAAGVPVLVSQESGLAQMLKLTLKEEERNWPREFLPVRGADADIEREWADALEEVLVGPHAAFARAAEVRQKIMAEFTWEKAITKLLAELGHPGGVVDI